MNPRQQLLQFLKTQRCLVIASYDGELWISNVFFGVDDNFCIYFVSGTNERHSQQIQKNPEIAFSTVWYNEQDHTDRKGIQGTGTCALAEAREDIETGTALHNQNFPQFAEKIGPTYIQAEENDAAVWVITPHYIKYWDDELFGNKATEEFRF